MILLLCAIVMAGAIRVPALASDTSIIYIETAKDLMELSKNCVLDTWSSGKTVILTKDIDLTGTEYDPIPLFMGNFDGQGHTVSGFEITKDASVTGFFRQILEGGTVKDLTVCGSVTPGGTAKTAGGIAGENHGEIRNCMFEGTVKGSRCTGGIAGSNGTAGMIDACSVNGTVSGEHRTGGIAGENLGSVISCTSSADVNTEVSGNVTFEETDISLSAEELIDITDAGGICGFSSGVIQGCINNGTVGYPRTGYNIGGIAGRQSGFMANCRNKGAVWGRKDVGGIVGQLDPDARWKFSDGQLDELQDMLDELQQQIDVFVSDVKDEKSAVTSKMSDILDAVEHTGSAARELSDEVSGWINDNLDAAAGIGQRTTALAGNLLPVCEELEALAGSLSLSADKFKDACAQLAEGADIADPRTEEAQKYIEAAANDARAASEAVAESIGHLKNGLGDAEDIQKAIASVSQVTEKISQAVKELSESIAYVSSLFEEIKTEDINAANSIKLAADLLKKINDSLPDLTEKMEKAGKLFADIAASVSDLTGRPDATELSEALDGLESAFGSAADAAEDISDLSTALKNAADSVLSVKPYLSQALKDIAASADHLGAAFSSAGRAGSDFESVIKSLSEEAPVSFSGISINSEAQKKLSDSLEEIRSALKNTVDEPDGSPLLDDLQAVSDQLFGIVEFITGSEGSSTGLYEYVEDISDSETRQSAGTVTGCLNYADIQAETNAGGIAGAVSIDISFDREDEWDLSALVSGGAKYLIFAVIRNCVNAASVSAMRETAGGIAGRMDYGLAAECESSGVITSSSGSAGGIAGSSLATIRNCCARVEVSSENYQGGIAGKGHDIYDCLAMPVFSASAEFQGAVAGDADGEIYGNFYSGCSLGGVNGFSFEGRAQEISFEELLERSEGTDLFSTVNVVFLAEGKTIAVMTVPLGGSIEVLPEVPDKGDKYWKWDEFDNTAVLSSITVEGKYLSPVKVLSSGEDLPLFLVEGDFAQGQELTVSPFEPDPALYEDEGADLLAAYSLSVSDYHSDLTVRMRADKDGDLYVLLPDGNYESLQGKRDGSYIVFDLANGGSFVYLSTGKRFDAWIVAAAAAAAAAVAAAFIVIKRKKKKAEKKAENGEPDENKDDKSQDDAASVE